MARLNIEKELYFIHIPKNAGTAFCNQFCKGHQIGHHSIYEFKNDNIINNSIAIVRNPYDRLVSIYEYNKTKESYWHRHDGKNAKTRPPFMHFCMNHTFSQFVVHLISGGFDKSKNHHIRTQYSFIKPRNGNIKTKLIHYENLNEELSQVIGKKVELMVENKSDREKPNWEAYYEGQFISIEKNGRRQNVSIKDLVYQYYKYDFMIGGYSK